MTGQVTGPQPAARPAAVAPVPASSGAEAQRLREDAARRAHWKQWGYFHGDTRQGLGAGHQTGWTAIVAKLLQQSGEPQGEP